MIIRVATLDDFQIVNEIEKSCFVEPYNEEHLLYEFKENPLNKILVAVEDNKVIGFINFMITFNSATITQVAVIPEYRKQGIATMLLREMEKSFPKDIDDVVETITLEVRKSNVAAIKLYEKDGYELVVEKKHYYKDGEDALYMVKRLLCQ